PGTGGACAKRSRYARCVLDCIDSGFGFFDYTGNKTGFDVIPFGRESWSVAFRAVAPVDIPSLSSVDLFRGLPDASLCALETAERSLGIPRRPSDLLDWRRRASLRRRQGAVAAVLVTTAIFISE